MDGAEGWARVFWVNLRSPVQHAEGNTRAPGKWETGCMALELNRRDLLKFFGIGATIVPVIGGAVKTELPARLIEEAKVVPVKGRAAFRTFSVQLQIGDGLSPETFSTIDAVSITGPNSWEPTKGPGDTGTIAFTILGDAAIPDIWEAFDRRVRSFRMVSHGDSCIRWRFYGYIERIDNSAPLDGEAVRLLTVRLNSPPSISTAHWS